MSKNKSTKRNSKGRPWSIKVNLWCINQLYNQIISIQHKSFQTNSSFFRLSEGKAVCNLLIRVKNEDIISFLHVYPSGKKKKDKELTSYSTGFHKVSLPKQTLCVCVYICVCVCTHLVGNGTLIESGQSFPEGVEYGE